MNNLIDALIYLCDPANLVGTGGILDLAAQQLVIVGIVVLIASAIAIPLGYFIGHTGRGKTIAVTLSGAARALPTLGLLTIVALFVGIGIVAPIVALSVLAIPPLLAGAYAGIEAVDRKTVDAARAVGMTEWQVLSKVEIPLGLPLLLGGLRSTVLQVVATATLAAITGSGGVGGIIFRGLALQDYPLMIVGSIVIIVMALSLDAILALVQRVATPEGVRLRTSGGSAATSGRPTPAPTATASA